MAEAAMRSFSLLRGDGVAFFAFWGYPDIGADLVSARDRFPFANQNGRAQGPPLQDYSEFSHISKTVPAEM